MAADSLADEVFAWHETGDGLVRISFRGRVVRALKGPAAARFMERVEGCDAGTAQRVMAKATGNFRRGNEREGKRRGRGR